MQIVSKVKREKLKGRVSKLGNRALILNWIHIIHEKKSSLEINNQLRLKPIVALLHIMHQYDKK